MTVTLTATEIVRGKDVAASLPADNFYGEHAALARLAWEDERTDVHGISCGHHHEGVSFDCHCGFSTATHFAEADAFAELTEHALTTCAVCQGSKHRDNFPRCSRHAF